MPLAWGGGIFGGGGGGAGNAGTGTAGRVGVWTGPGTIGGYAGFTFDSATNKATLLGGLIDSALTAGRVVIVGTAGEIEDDPGFLFAKTTDTLTLASGTVNAGLLKATALATPGSITVTPKLTQTGAITTVAVGTRPTGTITCTRVATRATGLITCVAKANLIDGETVTIDDGTGAEVFEFDLVPDGVGVGNVTVDVSTATTAEDVAALLSAAIVATFGAGTATNNLDGTITYQSNVFGVAGNIASSDTVADLGFSITGLSGAVAGIMDGETVTIDDGVSPATVFEFDISGGGVTPGNTAVVLNEGDLGATVAAALSPMINGIGAGLLVTSAVNGGTPEQLDLTGDAYNATGNVAITDTVVDAGFTVAGMSGGVDGLLDNETLILDDGTTAYTFQFNTGGIVPPTSVAVPIVEGQSADTVKTNLIAIINNTAILMTATDGGVATINLAQDTPGNLGGANSDTVANAGFAVTGMTSPAAATTVTYKLVARLADGTATEAGAASSTAASTATLSTSNLNRLTWSAVPNAVSYDIYRTVAPTSPATTGKIVASTTALTYDDTGLAGGGETAPTSNSTGRLVSTALTSGRVALVGTGGQIQDDAGLTYSGTGATARMAASGFNAVDGVIPATWFAASTTSNGLAAIKRWGGFDYGFVGNYDAGLYLGSAGTVRWTSTSFGDGTPDTSLSRISAGVVGVGTGAAGSVDGSIYADYHKVYSTSGIGAIGPTESSSRIGIYHNNTQVLGISAGSGQGFQGLGINSGYTLSWGTLGGVSDLFLYRRAAATLQLGAADAAEASTVAQTLAVQGSRAGTDSDAIGKPFVIQSSIGTGVGGGGDLSLRTAPKNAAGGTATVANTPTDRIILAGKQVTLTESSATPILDVAVASGTVAGGTVWYTIRADDATDFQSFRGQIQWAAVNKGGVLTASIAPVGADVVATSSGTLNSTATITTGTNSITINLTAVSSLTQTTLYAYVSAQLDGTGVATTK